MIAASLLAACSGGDHSLTSNNGGGGTPPPASIPADFSMPYAAPGDGVYLVDAAQLASSHKVVDGDVGAEDVVNDGEYVDDLISNQRPFAYVFVQNNQWYRLHLRHGADSSLTAFGAETQTICSSYLPFPNYAHPDSSVLVYMTAGADLACGNSDDEFHALRLDDGAAVAARNLGVLPPLRAFYAIDGALTGFVAPFNGDIDLFDASFNNPQTLIASVQAPRRAASFARTATRVDVRYRDQFGDAIIASVHADGTVDPPLYQAGSGVSLFGGYADRDAIYESISAGGGDEIERIPYAGNGVSTIYTGSAFVLGLTDHAVVLDAPTASGGEQLLLVRKDGSSTIQGPSANQFDFSGSFADRDRVLWTADDSSGAALEAGILGEDGSMIEDHPSSAWISIVSTQTDFTRSQQAPADGMLLLRGFGQTGESNVGDKGATLAYYDLARGTHADVATIDDAASIVPHFRYGLQIGLAGYARIDAAGNSQTDILSFNLPAQQINQVTDTPAISEVVE
jgi:hypothetical protein